MADVSDLESAQFLKHIIAYLENQFPRPCRHCGRQFDSFAQFVRGTAVIGEPQMWDSVQDVIEEVGHPIGALSFVNCSCGTTSTVECGDTSSDMYVAMVTALAHDVERTRQPASDVLAILRSEIRSRFASPKGNS